MKAKLLVAAALLAATAAAAQPARRVDPQTAAAARGQRSAAVLQAVIDCRRITDTAARLACFDAAAARLEQAESTGEVVVVDRSQVREARRQIFGFSVPAFDLFGGRNDNRAPEDRVDTLETTLSSSSVGRDGHLIFRLANGQVWRQYGSEPLRARPGATVVIVRGLIGSYFIRVGGQPGVRAQRMN